MTANSTTKVAFSVEKETKNTIRYAEQPPKDSEPLIGSLYLRKAAAAEMGNPASLEVSLSAKA